MAVVINNKTGRSDADHPTAMKVSRTPVFVDNCVHHGVYTRDKSAKKGKVTPSTRGDFQVTNDQSYIAVEEEGAIRLLHQQGAGHTYTGDVFFNRGTLNTGATVPTVMYGKDDSSQRLAAESIESASHGSRLVLQNMQGRSLEDIGFVQPSVRLGHDVDIGLRTTDMAVRLAEGVGDLTSMNIASKSKPSSTYEERVRHSQKFLSQDFRGVNLVTALRFIGKHDGRVLYYDRWGNLLYIPFRYGGTGRRLRGQVAFGNRTSDTTEDSPNRVTVVGKQRALNHIVTSTMDDRSSQQAKDDSETIREGPPVRNPSVKNISAARRVVREVLRSNAAAKGRMTATGLVDTWDLRAGDVVNYESFDGSQVVVIAQSSHHLSTKKSDFEFLALTTGVEGVLQGVAESAISMGDLLPERTTQLKKEDLSLFLNFRLRTTLLMAVRSVGQSGRRIGDSAASIIGRKSQTGYTAEGVNNGESAGSNKGRRRMMEVET